MSITVLPKVFTGISTDARPKTSNANLSPRSAGYVPPPVPGDKFVETDTGRSFVHVGGDNWELMP